MDTTNNFQQSVNANLKVFANYQPKGQLGNGTFELSDVGAVARNVGGSLVGGVLSTAEALSDPVLAAYYSITGRQSKARDIYLNSWSQTATDYLRGDDTGGETMQFVNSIAQGVGEQGTRLAISLGLAAITGGVVNPALTQNVLLGASAFGGGMQNAVQQTGELGLREHLYGIGSGLIEFGTEKLSDVAGLYGGSSKTIGGALGLLNVDGWTSKLLGQYANTVGGKLARTFMGEFGEEALSEILDVPLSKLTIDENASTSLKDVLAAGVQGGIVGAIMGGGQEVLNKSNYTKRGTDIVNNNLQDDVLKEGLELGNDYATYLQNRINAGAEVTPTQYGKLAMENQAKIVENGVEEIKDKYGIKSDKEARKKYADEVALDMMYANNGAGMFLTDETNTAENANAIEAYVQNGGSLDDLSDAARMLDRKGITVNYVYDTANDAEGTTIDGNNVTINLASEKFKSQIASHESYHTLSDEAKANLYNEISQTQWFKDNGQKILDRYSYEKTGDERTKNYTDEMRQEEVGARYMEQLINNPKAFIKEMQGKSGVIDDLTAFFKGYNKYSKNLPKSEKKAINKVYNEFLDAMKETATEKDSDTRYAILTDNDGDFVIADNNILLNNPNNLPVHELIRKNIMSHVGEIHKVLAYGDEVYLGKDLPVEYTQSKYTKALLKHAVSKLKAKHIISSNLGELIEIANNKTYDPNKKVKHNKDAKNGWYKYNTRFAVEKKKSNGTNDGANIYTGTLVVRHADDNKMYLYDILDIKKSSSTLTATDLAQLWAAKNAAVASPFSKNYTHNSQNVNTSNQKSSKNQQNNTNVIQHSLPESDYDSVLDHINDFKSVDELKSYFDTVQSNINEKYRNITPHTMKELNDIERNRVDEVIKAAELEKEAIKKWRSAHKTKKTVDLDTKAKIEATDKKYTQAIKDGDLDTARELVEQMAFLKGYSVTDYQMDHKAPINDGYNARLDDVTSMYGDDIYGKNAARYFGTFEGFDDESIRHIQEARDNPNKRVTIYRAVPSSVKGDQIRNGDWITLTYAYAKEHGENNIIGNYRIIKKIAQAKDIYTDGNSIHEFGYDDGNNYYYGDTANYRKLADVITFDDEGNPIRLRDRFNFRDDDVRYSLSETDYENVLAHVERFKNIKAINKYFDKKIDELDEYKNDHEKYMSEVEKIAEKEKAVIDKWQELKDAKKAERKAYAAVIRDVKNTVAFYNDEAFADSMPDEKWTDPKSKKIYTKNDIKRILDNVIKTELDDVYDLKYDGKKGALSDLTYQAFNKATEKDKLGVAMTVAEYLVDNAVLDESSEYEGVKSEALRVVDEISPYLHSFNLKSLRSDIKYHYDRSALPVYSRWGYRGRLSGVEVDDIYMILGRNGIVSGDNWDAPSQFFEIVEKYDAALADLKKSYKTAAKALFSDGEYRNIVENVANKLVEAYDTNGKKDALTVARDLNRTLKEQIKELRGQVRTVALEKNVSMQIQRMTQSAKEFAKRKYSSQAFSGEEAMAVNDAFSKVVVGSKISTGNAIHAVAVAKNFYTPERINGTLDGEATIGLYNQGIANDIEALSQTLKAGKSLDLDQLAALNRVMKAVTHVFQNIDTVIYEGKRRNTAEIGQKIIDEQSALPKVGKFFKQIRFFAENTCDPLAVFNLVNGYNDEATMVKMFNDVRNGETLMTTTKLNVLREFNDFGDAHKKYAKRLGTATVKLTVNDRATGVTEVREIPLDIAMQLYLTSKREHAQRGLFEAGFTYTDKDGYHRYLPTEEAVAEMYNNFTDEDKEYLKIAHKFFNKTCRDIKIAKDNEIYGFTNVEEGDDYIPIRRDDGIFTSPFNMTSYMKDFQTVSSLSMNKQTVKGTKSAISMQGLSAVVNMHAQQISLYNGLYEPIMAFTKVWDRNVTGKSTDVQSVKLTVRERTGSNKVEMYVSDLLKGIQGNSKVPQSKVISWMRSSYAKFQLGANLKTVAIQTSSYPMAMMYIKPKYLAKATKPTLPKATVYKYCPFLEVRATDSQFAKAQGVIDDVQGFTNILLKPIGVVDDAMTRRIFEAACYEVAEGTNREVFSDANMKEAAILTEKTVRNTQANALTSEKTAMMRSGSDLVKSLVMFSSDASKQLSRVADAIGSYYFAKRSKNENKIKAAKDGLTRSMATVTTSVAACTLIGLLVKHALGRDDDEKEFIQEYVTDFFGQLTGLVPIMRDAYTFFTDGYEVSNFAIDTVNNVYSGVNSSIKMLNRVINGEVLTDDEIVAPLKKVVFAAGQISGIPTRNLINQPTYFVKKWFLKEDSKQQKALFSNTSSSGSAISGDMFTVKK